MITWKYVEPLKVGGEVEVLQLKYSFPLPLDLVECVKKNNAGSPSLSTLDTSFAKNMVFGALLSFNESDDDNVYTFLPRFEIGYNKLSAFPFGIDPFGNLYCVKDNKIIFVDHETDESFPVANNFTEFLTMLR